MTDKLIKFSRSHDSTHRTAIDTNSVTPPSLLLRKMSKSFKEEHPLGTYHELSCVGMMLEMNVKGKKAKGLCIFVARSTRFGRSRKSREGNSTILGAAKRMNKTKRDPRKIEIPPDALSFFFQVVLDALNEIGGALCMQIGIILIAVE
jgi:hypothetical protein